MKIQGNTIGTTMKRADWNQHDKTKSDYIKNKSTITLELNKRANALVGNVSGEVVAMDDVSPLEHKIPVKVRSKNLIPYPYETKTTTISGVTFTDNGDGTIALSGTATEAIIFTPITSINAFYIDSGTYTFGSDIVGDFNSIYLQGKLIEDDSVSAAPIDKKATTFTITDSMHFRFNIRIAAGTNCDNVVIEPQLEKDTTASAFTPYIADDTEVTVKSCGKNLIPYPYYQNAREINGIKFTTNTDGSVVLNGTSTAPYASLVLVSGTNNSDFFKEGQAYTTGSTGEKHSEVALTVSYLDSEGKNRYHSNNKTFVWEKGNRLVSVYIQVLNAGSIFDNYTIYPIIAVGTEIPTNEPYIEGEEITTTLAEGAELTSIAPNMTIRTDKEGAIVECSYNKDTNIVIEKLTQAIISLGGNI